MFCLFWVDVYSLKLFLLGVCLVWFLDCCYVFWWVLRLSSLKFSFYIFGGRATSAMCARTTNFLDHASIEINVIAYACYAAYSSYFTIITFHFYPTNNTNIILSYNIIHIFIINHVSLNVLMFVLIRYPAPLSTICLVVKALYKS